MRFGAEEMNAAESCPTLFSSISAEWGSPAQPITGLHGHRAAMRRADIPAGNPADSDHLFLKGAKQPSSGRCDRTSVPQEGRRLALTSQSCRRALLRNTVHLASDCVDRLLDALNANIGRSDGRGRFGPSTRNPSGTPPRPRERRVARNQLCVAARRADATAHAITPHRIDDTRKHEWDGERQRHPAASWRDKERSTRLSAALRAQVVSGLHGRIYGSNRSWCRARCSHSSGEAMRKILTAGTGRRIYLAR